jgi:Rod binding domain-containing protein
MITGSTISDRLNTARLSAPSFTPAGARDGAGRAVGAEFRTIFHASRAEQTPEQEARGTAQDFVAQVLVQPLLKHLRSTNNAAAPFAPGDTEKAFRPLLDAEIASRMVRASNFPVVDSVARHLLRQSQLEGHDGAPPSPQQGSIR